MKVIKMKFFIKKFFTMHILITGGIFLLISDLLLFLIDGSLSHLNGSILDATFILMGIFIMAYKDHRYPILNKNSYLGMLGLTVYVGLVKTYIYIFKPAFADNPHFYFFVIGLISFLLLDIVVRKNASVWKNHFLEN